MCDMFVREDLDLKREYHNRYANLKRTRLHPLISRRDRSAKLARIANDKFKFNKSGRLHYSRNHAWSSDSLKNNI